MLEKMIELLVEAGYQQVEDFEGHSSLLGAKEFAVARLPKETMLIIGPGWAGDSGCHTNFYFNLQGDLENHGCCAGDDDLEDDDDTEDV